MNQALINIFTVQLLIMWIHTDSLAIFEHGILNLAYDVVPERSGNAYYSLLQNRIFWKVNELATSWPICLKVIEFLLG